MEEKSPVDEVGPLAEPQLPVGGEHADYNIRVRVKKRIRKRYPGADELRAFHLLCAGLDAVARADDLDKALALAWRKISLAHQDERGRAARAEMRRGMWVLPLTETPRPRKTPCGGRRRPAVRLSTRTAASSSDDPGGDPEPSEAAGLVHLAAPRSTQLAVALGGWSS